MPESRTKNTVAYLKVSCGPSHLRNEIIIKMFAMLKIMPNFNPGLRLF